MYRLKYPDVYIYTYTYTYTHVYTSVNKYACNIYVQGSVQS